MLARQAHRLECRRDFALSGPISARVQSSAQHQEVEYLTVEGCQRLHVVAGLEPRGADLSHQCRFTLLALGSGQVQRRRFLHARGVEPDLHLHRFQRRRVGF